MEALFGRIRLYAVVDDLKYLRMGERLFSAGAMVGTPLGVKPIIGLRTGAEPKDGFRLRAIYSDDGSVSTRWGAVLRHCLQYSPLAA